MPRVKQASKQKRTTKAAAMKALGAALGLSLAGGASASTPTAADAPQSPNVRPNQSFILGEEEIADVSLATFHLFDKENVGTGFQQMARGCGGCRGRGCRGCGCGGCRGCGTGNTSGGGCSGDASQSGGQPQ